MIRWTNDGRLQSTHDWVLETRPWWWWLNPWLYIRQRDRAYADALDSLQETE